MQPYMKRFLLCAGCPRITDFLYPRPLVWGIGLLGSQAPSVRASTDVAKKVMVVSSVVGVKIIN